MHCLERGGGLYQINQKKLEPCFPNTLNHSVHHLLQAINPKTRPWDSAAVIPSYPPGLSPCTGPTGPGVVLGLSILCTGHGNITLNIVTRCTCLGCPAPLLQAHHHTWAEGRVKHLGHCFLFATAQVFSQSHKLYSDVIGWASQFNQSEHCRPNFFPNPWRHNFFQYGVLSWFKVP